MLAIRKKTIFLVALLLASCSLVWAADAGQANDHYQDQQWQQAAEAYREIVAANPSDGRAQYRLAVSLRHLRDFDGARGHIDAAAAAGIPVPFVAIERARLAVAAGDTDGAFEALERAAAAGFPNPGAIEQDADLQSLKDDERFALLMAKLRRNAAPCEHIDEYRQFDFWLGHWRVLDTNDVFQGHNRIVARESGCVLVENWASSAGTTGMSMNFYDLSAAEWAQVWISGGIQLEIRGGLTDGSMALTGRIHYNASGNDRAFRGTWTPLDDGVVRQHFEESQDEGKTWYTWFDGYYYPVGHPNGPEQPAKDGA